MIKTLISAAVLGAITFAAPAFAQTKLSVGASYVPHAEILEQAKWPAAGFVDSWLS